MMVFYLNLYNLVIKYAKWYIETTVWRFFFLLFRVKKRYASLSSSRPFYISDTNEEEEEENNILKHEKSSEFVAVDSYYTSYTYNLNLVYIISQPF